MSDTGLHKAAILMLAIGQDEAAAVMQHMDPRDVQKLGVAMANIKKIQANELEEALNDFEEQTIGSSSLGVDNEEYIRNVLSKAMGEEEAANLLNRIMGVSDSSGIESLNSMDSKSVADLIRYEHPQIIATIIVHLDPLKASEVLTEFSDQVRTEVIMRIATLDGVQPQAINELNEVLTKLLTGNENTKKKTIGGIKASASILNFMRTDLENAVMDKVRAFDEYIAKEIVANMFVFDDLIGIPDRDIQLILREIPSEALIVALKGAPEHIQEKIFKNMSQRAAEMMKEDLEAKGPVRLSDVDKQQREILQIILNLAEQGKISLRSEGEEEAFV